MNDSERVSEAVIPTPPSSVSPSIKATGRKRSRSGNAAREVVETLVLTLLIFLGVRVLVQNYKVEGYSMQPTLEDGQYLLINKIGLHFRQPERGDVIVFKYPVDPTKSFVKRVIGLPGDTVEVRDREVYVNDQKLIEPYIKEAPNSGIPRTIVPPGDYFVMGDNRNNSSDSRMWGPLPEDDVIGEAWLTYWPPKEWGAVPQFRYPGFASK